MLCGEGTELLRVFEGAVLRRAKARDVLLLTPAPMGRYEDVLFRAKVGYNSALVDWLTHRGSCLECRAASIRNDMAEFASV